MDTLEQSDTALRRPSDKELPPEIRRIYLLNPTRKRIHELVEQQPGINQNQLAEAAHVTTSTIAYHLERLGKTGHIITITSPKSNEKLSFTPDNVYLWSAKPFRLLLGRATPRKVAQYLTKYPGATTKQIAQALELSVPTIQRHVRKLQEENLIQATRVDRHVYYHAEQRLVEWLERMGRG